MDKNKKSDKSMKFDKTLKLDAEGKKEALEAALIQIDKQFGKGSIMRMGDAANMNIDVIPTGILSLDIALGAGGIPRGRIIEIFGPESSGKTTVALHIVAEAQKIGGTAAFIDAEHALDPQYALKLGVNIKDLLISQPDMGEQALEIAEALVRSNSVDIIVIDSVAALVPRAELEGDMGDSHMGAQARLMSQALRKLTAIIGRTNSTIIFINQIRDKIGVVYGSPETTTGGRALKFYSSLRIDIRKSDVIKSGTEFVGNRTKAKIVKNKIAPPFKIAEFDMIFGEGVSREGSLLDVAVDLDFIDKSGAWFSYGEERIGQGRENAKKYLKENPNIYIEVETKVMDAIKNKDVSTFGDKKKSKDIDLDDDNMEMQELDIE